MKTKLALALCAALVLSSSAFAQQDDHRGGDDQHQRNAVMHDRGSQSGNS